MCVYLNLLTFQFCPWFASVNVDRPHTHTLLCESNSKLCESQHLVLIPVTLCCIRNVYNALVNVKRQFVARMFEYRAFNSSLHGCHPMRCVSECELFFEFVFVFSRFYADTDKEMLCGLLGQTFKLRVLIWSLKIIY